MRNKNLYVSVIVGDHDVHQPLAVKNPIKEAALAYVYCEICKVTWPCWAAKQAVQPIEIFNDDVVESTHV